MVQQSGDPSGSKNVALLGENQFCLRAVVSGSIDGARAPRYAVLQRYLGTPVMYSMEMRFDRIGTQVSVKFQLRQGYLDMDGTDERSERP